MMRPAIEAPLRVLGIMVVALVIVAAPRPASAQETARHTFLLETQANTDDLYLGLNYRLGLALEQRLGVTLSASVRPYLEWVRKPVRPRVFMQLRERRYCFALAVDQEVPLICPFGLYVGAGLGYTAADFDGTHASPKEGWIPVADGGIRCALAVEEAAYIEMRLGYRYSEARADENHWIYLSLGVGI
jgi:hypothetical protein